MKKKLSVLITLVVALSLLFVLPISANAEALDGFYYDEYDGYWYYYRDGAMVMDEIIEYGNYLYAFNDWGRMYENEDFWLYDEETDEGYYYRAKVGGPLCENEWHWDDWNESWYYYGENGIAPSDEFLTVGGKRYYFEHNGCMFTDGARFDPETDTWYAFDENGAYEPIDMSTPGWKQHKGNWYYVVEDEYEQGNLYLAPSGLLTTDNGIAYLFNHKYAMATNEFVTTWEYNEEEEFYYSSYYYANAYGMPHIGWIRPYANENRPGYEYMKDAWYYFGADGKALEGYQTVNGTAYYFDVEGRMLTNDYGIVEADDDYAAYAWATDKNGIASYTYGGWLKVYDVWRYFDGSDWLEDGVHEIGGSYYLFRWGGEMLDNDTYEGYRAKKGGRLYCNEWYKEDGRWYYYDAQCRMVTDALMNIGGTYYAFDPSGEMRTNQLVFDAFGKAYILDENGVGTQATGTGWYAVGERWVYAEDGWLVHDGWKTIGGSDYFFEGYYILQDTQYGPYLFSAGGAQIKTEGWHVVDGEYYYVKNSDGEIAEGWYAVGGAVSGRWYYFFPSMAHNTVVEDYETGYVYGFDTNGRYFQVTGDGFYTSYPGLTMYIKNNKLVTDAWEYINGYWYYFDEDGWKVEGARYVDGAHYLFDSEGRLVYNNWCNVYGETFHSDAAGKVLTGYRYIDGKYYLFSEDGWLYGGGVVYDGGYTYLLHEDGSVYGYEFTPYTWYKVDGEWYYYDADDFLWEETKVIGGYEYAFDYNNQMVTDEYYDDYYFDRFGHKLMNAWQNTPYGYRYFDKDGDLYHWGYYLIDGTEYYFDYGYLKVGTFVDEYGELVTTTGGGAVISQTPLSDGWTYADGKFHYVDDGDPYYTGWVGSYYVQNGVMLYDHIVRDDGNWYYVDTNGVYVNSGWYNVGGNNYPRYIYANSNGTLKYNEWARINGVWYYFEDCYMVADTICYIDGEYHKFAKSGAWLGQIDVDASNGYANGWVYLDGDYYYSYNGRFLNGAALIDGTWYFFDYYSDMPRMLADEYWQGQYYTASGALFEKTGWQIINGHYVYFDEDSCARSGLIEVDGTQYYISRKYIDDADRVKYEYRMVSKGHVMANGKLYYASASGALSKVTAPNGWYWIENWEQYVYYKNGTLLRDGEYVINGATYYFYEDGGMASDDWIGYHYYGASGAKVTGSGWYWSDNYDGWVYVNKGKMYVEGLYYINGTAYYFYDGLWVQ